MVRGIAAFVMCAIVALVAAAPMAQSSEQDDTVHVVIMDTNGPPSTEAIAWEWIAPSDGTWHGHVVNDGLRWLWLDMVDYGTYDVLIDRDIYRFAVYGNVFDSDSVPVLEGHTYIITATPNGPLYTSATVEDIFTPA